MKHLLKLEDWSTDEIINTLNLADQLKYEQKHGIEHKILAGKTLGMIFEKSSTRTRVSFEVGMTQLGGVWAVPFFLSSFHPMTYRSAEASLFRIPQEFSLVFLTVL